jgi:hypothetical protein
MGEEFMISGIEPALAKVAGVATTRAAGWTGRGIAKTWKVRQIRRLLKESAPDAQRVDLLSRLGPAQAKEIEEFISSPNLEHIAFELASVYLIDITDKKRKEALKAVHNELRQGLRVAVTADSETIGALAAEIFSLTVSGVRQYTGAYGCFSTIATHSDRAYKDCCWPG